jgi:hypothetical protein
VSCRWSTRARGGLLVSLSLPAKPCPMPKLSTMRAETSCWGGDFILVRAGADKVALLSADRAFGTTAGLGHAERFAMRLGKVQRKGSRCQNGASEGQWCRGLTADSLLYIPFSPKISSPRFPNCPSSAVQIPLWFARCKRCKKRKAESDCQL